MEIDFGGIGKEYAADRAATVCLEQGIAHGFVNLGGDVRVVGPQPDGAPWRIGIRHPRPSRTDADEAIAGIELTEGAVATSGDYERYFDIDGERYCHLLDAAPAARCGIGSRSALSHRCVSWLAAARPSRCCSRVTPSRFSTHSG